MTTNDDIVRTRRDSFARTMRTRVRASLKALGLKPLPRRVMARLTDRLWHACGVGMSDSQLRMYTLYFWQEMRGRDEI